MNNNKTDVSFDMEKYGIYNTSGSIKSDTSLTKEEILSTGDWYEAENSNIIEGYFWKHKNINDDEYTFYMRRYKNDGLTVIKEIRKEDNILFEGYIKNLKELGHIVHLCRLYEI